MKKVIFIAVLISFMFITVNAQVALSIYSGVGRSSFDKNMIKDIINNPITDLADFSLSSPIYSYRGAINIQSPISFNFWCRCKLCSCPVYF